MPYFQKDNLKLYYEDVGEGEPIIANHGLMEDVTYWSETGVTAELAKKYRMISMDMRGHGRTIVKGEPFGYDADTMATDIEYLADTTPFLKELISKKEAARYSLQSEKADFFPKVYLDGFIGKVSSDFPPDQSEWSVGLSLSLPIFEGGRRLAEVSKAESMLNQAEADIRSGRDSGLVTLEDTWKTLQDSITNVSVRKKFLDAAEERAKIASTQYETGLISFDDWIIIENNLVLTRKTFLKAQADMLLAEAYWIQATGGTLEYEEE